MKQIVPEQIIGILLDESKKNGSTDAEVVLSKKTGKPGNVLDENLTVACGCGSIKILKIQREGKNSQNNTEFLLGSKIKKGSFLNAE